MIHKVYLGLGTNLGDKEANIHQALAYIREEMGTIDRCSSLLVSEPWGFDSPNSFVNAVCCVFTEQSPEQLLRTAKSIEKKMGRKSKSVGGVYHDRIIDIDILLYDNIHLSTPELTIPHPLMHERPFVMEPLMEITNGEPTTCLS